MKRNVFTVHDVIEAQTTLEPLACVFCGSEEVTFMQGVGDAKCGDCGRWQLDRALFSEVEIGAHFVPMTNDPDAPDTVWQRTEDDKEEYGYCGRNDCSGYLNAEAGSAVIHFCHDEEVTFI